MEASLRTSGPPFAETERQTECPSPINKAYDQKRPYMAWPIQVPLLNPGCIYILYYPDSGKKLAYQARLKIINN